MDHIQYCNEEHMNEDFLHYGEEEKDEVMIQEDFEEQAESSSNVPNTDKIENRELMCITLTLKRFQHTFVDDHQSLEKEI